jgi:hypothetical protein
VATPPAFYREHFVALMTFPIHPLKIILLSPSFSTLRVYPLLPLPVLKIGVLFIQENKTRQRKKKKKRKNKAK